MNSNDIDHSGLRVFPAYRTADTAARASWSTDATRAAQTIALSNLAVAEAIHRLVGELRK